MPSGRTTMYTWLPPRVCAGACGHARTHHAHLSIYKSGAWFQVWTRALHCTRARTRTHTHTHAHAHTHTLRYICARLILLLSGTGRTGTHGLKRRVTGCPPISVKVEAAARRIPHAATRNDRGRQIPSVRSSCGVRRTLAYVASERHCEHARRAAGASGASDAVPHTERVGRLELGRHSRSRSCTASLHSVPLARIEPHRRAGGRTTIYAWLLPRVCAGAWGHRRPYLSIPLQP